MTAVEIGRLADLLPEGKTSLDRLNGSRKEIVVAIKVYENLTVDQLAEMLGITPSGTRQQLSLLESEGYVNYTEIGEARAGRRRRRYRLTPAAEALFPSIGDDLTISLLEQLREENPDRADRFIEKWGEPIGQRLRAFIASRPAGTPPEAVAGALRDQYREGGFLPVFQTVGRDLTITLHHCPWKNITGEARWICNAEVQAIQKNFPGSTAERTSWCHDGDRVCTFAVHLPG